MVTTARVAAAAQWDSYSFHSASSYSYTSQCRRRISTTKCPFPWGIWTPLPHGFSVPCEFVSQTAFRSVHPFIQGSPVSPTHCVQRDKRSVKRTATFPFAEMKLMYVWATMSCKGKVKFSHTRYRALGPELIPVYRQSARR